MKTYLDLFDKITSFDNLLAAAGRAQEGKLFKADVAKFNFRQASELLQLQRELRSRTYRPGAYTTFMVYDPKERMISAAPFRDRVVHHALCAVIEPIFEKTFIHDSYANRKGKGTHRAIKRYQHYARQYRYVLKCDIRKFFPSIDHAVLKEAIRWRVQCHNTLWLCDLIIDNSNEQEAVPDWFGGAVAGTDLTTFEKLSNLLAPPPRRRGLPIGNLTSQFWANVYLNRFDHFVKEELGAPGYVRYVDDFVLFSNSANTLHEWQERLTAHLARLRLLPHPNKTHLHRTASGVPFLGFRVWPQHRVVSKAKAHRYERHLRSVLASGIGATSAGAARSRPGTAKPLDKQKLEQGLNSWRGHVRFGQSRRLEYRVFWQVREAGVNLHTHPSGGWRVL